MKLGEIKYCLKWNSRSDRKRKMLTTNQHQYVIDILNKFGMTKCNLSATPANSNTHFKKGIDTTRTNGTKRLQVFNSLSYLAACTRLV